jgi:hypothetical protein
MEVHGIDMEQGAYRVSFRSGGRTLRGLVPETLVAEWLRQSGRPEHGDVYEWIAVHRSKIEQALTRMSEGKANIRAPYDRLTLVEE